MCHYPNLNLNLNQSLFRNPIRYWSLLLLFLPLQCWRCFHHYHDCSHYRLEYRRCSPSPALPLSITLSLLPLLSFSISLWASTLMPVIVTVDSPTVAASIMSADRYNLLLFFVSLELIVGVRKSWILKLPILRTY